MNVSSPSAPALNPSSLSIEACRQIFGEHPEDVLSPIRAAADALFQLEEICKTISREALDGRNGYRLRRLADAGAYLASNIGEYVGYEHEQKLSRLIAAGVVAAEASDE